MVGLVTSARACETTGVVGKREADVGVALAPEKLRAALGPVGGALSAAGPRGGERARGGDRRGVWFLGVEVRKGMALASLKPAGEWTGGETWRERAS